MKKMTFMTFLSAIMLSGCVTQPPTPDEVQLVSPERLYDQSLYKPQGERNIPVRITRDSGFQGSLATLFLKIDGKYVVWLNSSEEITIYLSEGGYVFELIASMCPNKPSCIYASDATIKKGFENNFRIQAKDGFKLIRSRT
jgi:hypothetical protein